jgi:hypothetical protein
MQVQQKLREALRGERLAPDLEAWLADAERPEYAAETQRLLLLDGRALDQAASILLAHIWIAFVNDNPQPLWTSDHPVVRRSYVSHPVLGTLGLGSPGIEISFPLSHRLMLVMYDRGVFGELSVADGRVMRQMPENVIYHNALEVEQSYRQVYSPTADFSLAEEVRREHPEVFQADRTRIEA